MNPNPYESPQHSVNYELRSESPIFWSMATVFSSVVLGGTLGLMVGAMLGALAPGYYRSVIVNGNSPDFNPVVVGVGLGLSQGAALGAFVGLVLAGMYYRYRTRQAMRERLR